MTPPTSRTNPAPYIVAWVLLVPYGLLCALMAFADPASGHGAHQAGYVVGQVIAAVGVPLVILAFGTWKRSVGALGAAGLVAALFVMGSAARMGTRFTARKTRIEKLQASVDELRKRTAASGKGPAASPEDVDRLVAEIEHTADEAGDHEADALRCAARMIRDLATRGRAYDGLIGEMGTLGMLDPTRIQTRDDLARRTALLTRAEAANDAVEAAVRDMAPGFERCLRAHDVSAEMIRGGVEAMQRDKRIPALLAFREVERRVLAAMGGILSFLDEGWGTWRPKGDKLVMDRPGDPARYGRLKETLDSATRDEAESLRAIAAAGPR